MYIDNLKQLDSFAEL